MSNPTRTFLLGPLLKSVSRSFYLTLRVLPVGMRDPVGLAYLRCASHIAFCIARSLRLILKSVHCSIAPQNPVNWPTDLR
jgi:hypothetical protein